MLPRVGSGSTTLRGEERAATHEAGMPGRNRAALVITSVQGMASTIVYVGMDGRVGRAISRLGDAAAARRLCIRFLFFLSARPCSRS